MASLCMMAAPVDDPYAALGVRPGVGDEELRAAYRRLAKLHHPDHNGGSPEAARCFEKIQDAYTRIRVSRQRAGLGAPPPAGARPTTGTRSAAGDPTLEARLAELERELREARMTQLARERAERELREVRQRAQQAARAAVDPGTPSGGRERPSDEELGYIRTEDSFSKIIADAREELAARFKR
ncbi:MAG: J domain-containing protein [Solirubrobacteraceae bacterium]